MNQQVIRKNIKFLVLALATLPNIAFSSTITIAVAANVSYAIDELKSQFCKQYPDIKVRVVLGSSGKLTAQIKNAAPYGLFMSADMKYPNSLYKDGLTTNKPIVYAQGALAYLSKRDRDFSSGMKLLENKSIKKIAVANPKTAPYGIAAAQAMRSAGVYDKLKPKFVYGESVSQTVTYSITAADIGLIAKSALFNPHMSRYKKAQNWSCVDTKLYKPIHQGMVMLKSAKSPKDVRKFYDFILSQKAKDIFIRYGYITL